MGHGMILDSRVREGAILKGATLTLLTLQQLRAGTNMCLGLLGLSVLTPNFPFHVHRPSHLHLSILHLVDLVDIIYIIDDIFTISTHIGLDHLASRILSISFTQMPIDIC